MFYVALEQLWQVWENNPNDVSYTEGNVYWFAVWDQVILELNPKILTASILTILLKMYFLSTITPTTK